METGKPIACFGEVMLRLGAPGKLRLAQSLPGTLEATFGGGEANVCASLAMLGSKSRYLSALPDNPVSRAFAAQLRGIGADTDHILYTQGGAHGNLLRGAWRSAASLECHLRPRALGHCRIRTGML